MKTLLLTLNILIIVTIGFTESVVAQNNITFEDNRMYISSKTGSQWSTPELFTPLGWFGASDIYNNSVKVNRETIAETVSELEYAGGNTIILYYNAIVDA